MTLLKEAKALTVEQYKFYKTQVNPLTDKAVMKLHGMDNNHFYAWKKQHKLNGVKFEPKVKVSSVKTTKEAPASSSVEDKPKLLREKEVLPATATNKALVYENNDLKPSVSFFELGVKQELPEKEKRPTEPYKHEITNADDFETVGALSVGKPSHVSYIGEKVEPVNLLKVEIEELKKEKVWLEERHGQDTEDMRLLQLEVEKWKNKFHAEREQNDSVYAKVSELERMLSNQQVNHEIEVRNLKSENRRLDQALALHSQDENLLFLTMEKAVQLRGRVLETTVEGGSDKWR